jgi:hypothetical protein
MREENLGHIHQMRLLQELSKRLVKVLLKYGLRQRIQELMEEILTQAYLSLLEGY